MQSVRAASPNAGVLRAAVVCADALTQHAFATAVQPSALEPGAISGRANMFAAKIRRDRVPGRPSIGLFPSAEYRRLSASSQRRGNTLADRSRHADACVPPTLLPPDIMTASHSSSAAHGFSSTCTSSGHMPYLTHRAPKRREHRAEHQALRRASVPFAGAQPASTSSSPVEITPTLFCL